MSRRVHVALLTALAAMTAQAQDINVYSTTMAQTWKQDTPGFDKANYLPATEFLGIDVNRLGMDNLSMHFYGWGYTDLQDQSTVGGKNAGNLTYGYLQYDFDQANAQIKAGRFTVNQGVGNEQVDGVSVRTDLRGGFTFSAFGGTPVIFKNLDSQPQWQQDYQKNLIFGARLGWRAGHIGEIGVSYLQDGSNAAKDLPVPEQVDYSRRQLGVDMKFDPWSFLDISGRTVFDVAKSRQVAPGVDRSNIAEHDYAATGKLTDTLALTATYVERNFYAYYAGSTLPSLFDMNEKGMFSSRGASLAWTGVSNLEFTADVKENKRDLYGITTRYGGDFRYNFAGAHILAGAGFHKVNAFDVVAVDPLVPSYSLSHREARAWAMYENGAFSASVDGIRFSYVDAASNPNLYGKSIESQIVGSVGYQFLANLKVSADMSVEDTPLYRKQAMGLIRIDWKFGFSGKGGK